MKKIIRRALVILCAVLVIAGVTALYLHRKAVLAQEGMTVHFIDVGQGDCTLIQCGGKNILVDCGEEEMYNKVEEYLRSLGVKRIDTLIATHPHSDHMGGMYHIVNDLHVDTAYIPAMKNRDIPSVYFFERFLDACEANHTKLKETKAGKKLKIGNASIKVIAPNRKGYDNMNDYSVCFILTYGGTRFLFTGDAEEVSENEMLANGWLRSVDVYKAGHHGSSSSSSKEFLSAVSPDIAVISCGEDNAYGHPSAKTLKALGKYAEQIYRTDRNGTVVIHSDGSELTVSTEKE